MAAPCPVPIPIDRVLHVDADAVHRLGLAPAVHQLGVVGTQMRSHFAQRRRALAASALEAHGGDLAAAMAELGAPAILFRPPARTPTVDPLPEWATLTWDPVDALPALLRVRTLAHLGRAAARQILRHRRAILLTAVLEHGGLRPAARAAGIPAGSMSSVLLRAAPTLDPPPPPPACGTWDGYLHHLAHARPPCAPCAQAGEDHMTPSTAPGRTVRPHGTLAAYARHRSYGEDPCDDCKDASRRYSAQYRRDMARHLRRPVPLTHGTPTGYETHLERGEDPCERCTRAWATRHSKEPAPAPCGTYAGLQRHHRKGTPVCQPCKAARAEYRRQRRAQLRQQRP